MRNRIAHGYETVNQRLVWRIVSDDLPGLRAAIARLLAPPGLYGNAMMLFGDAKKITARS